MNKIFFTLAGLAFMASCQNEFYNKPQEDFGSEQGVYFTSTDPVQVFVEEGQERVLRDLKVALSVKESTEYAVTVTAGEEAQLDAYNRANGTSYKVLPKDMYVIPSAIEFQPNITEVVLPVTLTEQLAFETGIDYAIPIKIEGNGVGIIPNENETLVVLERRIHTKSLRMGGSEAGDATMYPSDFKVDQWTIEAMVNRASYKANNRSIVGTKQVEGGSVLDEIYPRFGDVTIEPNQLQIKTGGSQIDIPKDKFAAEPNVWYMLAFVYDGQKTYVYVNGEVVAEQEIRTGPYGLVGLWIGGANELIREVRLWDIARTPQQLKAYVWKMVDPTDPNLLLYYPGNGQKRNPETGEITDDETMIWDWTKNQHHLTLPSRAYFDDNGGNYFVFPEE